MSKSEDAEWQEQLLLPKTKIGHGDAVLHPDNEQGSIYKHCLKDTRVWRAVSFLSLLANMLLTGSLLYVIWPSTTPVFPGILHDTPTVGRSYEVITDYSYEGDTTPMNEALWDNILGVHGIVAVDTNWAKKHHLLQSRPLLSDTSRSVYAIEAYHALHCLKRTRKAFFTLLHHGNETGFGETPAHINHCFDILKQSITCSAADNLLAYTKDGFRNGQVRQCKDWEALRDWSTRHTPCIGDISKNWDIHGNFCHGGDDGVRLND